MSGEILITGATGHIGNVLARQLAGRGERVRALVLPSEDTRPLEGIDVSCVVGDVLDQGSLQRAFRGVRAAFHLAGLISILPGHDPTVHRVNVEGTLNVLSAARQAGVERLVYTSSIHAIRRIPHGAAIDELVPYDPQNAISAYDRSKAEASLAVLAAAGDGLDAVLACPTGVIGPYDFRLSEMGRLILAGLRQRVMLCTEGAYDFVDVRDVARGLMDALDRGRRGESYILSGERIGMQALLHLARRCAGLTGSLVTLPVRLARAVAPLAASYYRLTRTRPLLTPYAVETVMSNSVISHAKASRELGYAPRRLADSVADAVTWFSERGLLRPRTASS